MSRYQDALLIAEATETARRYGDALERQGTYMALLDTAADALETLEQENIALAAQLEHARAEADRLGDRAGQLEDTVSTIIGLAASAFAENCSAPVWSVEQAAPLKRLSKEWARSTSTFDAAHAAAWISERWHTELLDTDTDTTGVQS